MNITIPDACTAGLACADALVAAGQVVSVFDKGRAPGGRMATRRVPTWQAAGLAAPWPAAGPGASVGTPSMAAPVRAMAQPHAIRFPVQVDTIGYDGRDWMVGGTPFDAVAIALPAEHAAAILRPVHPSFAALAAQTPTAPCWTVMAAFPAPLPGPDILRQEGPIGWAARNSANQSAPAPKPGSHEDRAVVPSCDTHPVTVVVSLHPTRWPELAKFVANSPADFRLLSKLTPDVSGWIVYVGRKTEGARGRLNETWG